MGGSLVFCIAQYKDFLKFSVDFLYICESLKIAWLINQTKFTSTLKLFFLVALL